jgi:hypothetical protein
MKDEIALEERSLNVPKHLTDMDMCGIAATIPSMTWL